MDRIRKHFEEAYHALSSFLADDRNMQKIAEAADQMTSALKGGNKIISCGNGGSMSDAMHFAEELSGRFRNDRQAYAAVSISDPSHITCVGNDYGFDKIFSRYIEAVGREGDILLALSTSGNSANILEAVNAAKSKGIYVVGLTGKDGGKMASLVDLEIRAPFSEFSDRAQEIHIKIIHALIDSIEHRMSK